MNGAQLTAVHRLRGSLDEAAVRPAFQRDVIVRDAIEGLGTSFGFDVAALSLWLPGEGVHGESIHSDYPAPFLRWAEEFIHTDPFFDVLGPGNLPIRLADLPYDLREGPIIDEVIRPLRVTDGLTHRVYAPDGRYLGVLNLSRMGGKMSDDVVDAVRLIDSAFATAIDPLAPRRVASSFDITTDTVVVVEPRGRRTVLCDSAALDPATLPGAARHVVDAVAGGFHQGARLLIAGERRVVAVRVDAVAGGALVIMTRVDPPSGLTRRELQVLALLGRAVTARGIASALALSIGTVNAHTSSILRKLGAPNRTAAAVVAARMNVVLDGPRVPGSPEPF